MLTMQVHLFVELKHAQQEPEDGSNLVTACLFTHKDGHLHHRTQALGTVMFDNHVHFSSFRFICPVMEPMPEKEQLWAGLGLGAYTYTPRIPITEVGIKLAPCICGLGMSSSMQSPESKSMSINAIHVYVTASACHPTAGLALARPHPLAGLPC